MEWKGEQLLTIGAIQRSVENCKTIEEAQHFMKCYRIFTTNADVNIGYISGDYEHEEMKRIQSWFGVNHPVNN